MINLNINQILTQNSKLKKTSKLNNKRVFNFGIIANKSLEGKSTCPFAKGCLGADYKCYAQKGAYAWPSVKNAYNNRYLLTKQDNFVNLMNEAIQKKKVDILRLHDSGDFYSIAYLNKWIQIANDNKDVKAIIDAQIQLAKDNIKQSIAAVSDRLSYLRANIIKKTLLTQQQ